MNQANILMTNYPKDQIKIPFNIIKPQKDSTRIGVVGNIKLNEKEEKQATSFLEKIYNIIEKEFEGKEIIIISNGIRDGVPLIAHKIATKRGYKNCAVVREGTNPGILCEEINKKDIIFFGKNEEERSQVFIYGVEKIKKFNLEKYLIYESHPHRGLNSLIKFGNTNTRANYEAELIRKEELPIYEDKFSKYDNNFPQKSKIYPIIN